MTADPRALGEFIRLPFDRRHQPQRIEYCGPQLGPDALDRFDRGIDVAERPVGPLVQRGVVGGEPALQP